MLDKTRAVFYAAGAVFLGYGIVTQEELGAHLALVDALLVLAFANVPLIKRLWAGRFSSQTPETQSE